MQRRQGSLTVGFEVPVKNGTIAEQFLHSFCESRHARGYRLRYAAGPSDKSVYVEHDSLYSIEMAIQALKDTGLVTGKIVRKW